MIVKIYNGSQTLVCFGKISLPVVRQTLLRKLRNYYQINEILNENHNNLQLRHHNSRSTMTSLRTALSKIRSVFTRTSLVIKYQIYWIDNNIPDSSHFWPSRLKSAWTVPPPCDWWYSLMLITLNVCVLSIFFHLLCGPPP